MLVDVFHLFGVRRGEVLSDGPQVWQKQLCEVIGHRDFSGEERGRLLDQAPEGPLCA